jgi:hypothetical protein
MIYRVKFRTTLEDAKANLNGSVTGILTMSTTSAFQHDDSVALNA